jgi:16S rRNA (guanine(527)-N(7))-methyltransferase RsmG
VFRERLLERVSGFSELSGFQLDQLEQHYELMLRWNRTINLTRIEGVEEAVDRHYSESLFLGASLPSGPIRIADVGSGAGFPGFPIAVLRPECSVSLIESHKRKAVFLREASRELGNISVISERAGDVTEKFDWVVSRAVSWKDIQKFAFRLAPNLALLGTDAPGSVIPFPWAEDRGVVFVSRETVTSGST